MKFAANLQTITIVVGVQNEGPGVRFCGDFGTCFNDLPRKMLQNSDSWKSQFCHHRWRLMMPNKRLPMNPTRRRRRLICDPGIPRVFFKCLLSRVLLIWIGSHFCLTGLGECLEEASKRWEVPQGSSKNVAGPFQSCPLQTPLELQPQKSGWLPKPFHKHLCCSLCLWNWRIESSITFSS